MENPCPISPQLIVFLITSYSIISMLSKPKPWTTQALPDITKTPSPNNPTRLRTDPEAIRAASNDYGNLIHEAPSAVLYPTSIDDIIELVKFSYNSPTPFPIAARGCGHSVRGQAMAGHGGVVVDMGSLGGNNESGIRVSWSPEWGYYADVGGGRRWVEVLTAAAEHGLAPVSWTDYLYLSVGGTLSNGGISGQSFLHGPQISNVLELDVITGKGELVTCSKDKNWELFNAVLGGLGQFGIITRARIILDKAPSRAKWVRLVYSDFSMFTRDQEHLISSTQGDGPDYVEGSLITNQSPLNNWRSSFYSPQDQSKILSFLQQNQGLLYSIELVKYYDHSTAHTIDQEIELVLRDLNFSPGFIFKKDVPLLDFLTRINGSTEDKNTQQAHPWLNLFVPKSRIVDFNDAVFVRMIRTFNHTSGPMLFYPLKKEKWDDGMSAVTPDEDIFYTLGLLPTSGTNESADVYEQLNREIIEFCKKSGIKIKQYLPYYESKEDWIEHYGSKWATFQERKLKFDPRMILSPGQRIFTPVTVSDI